MIYRFYLDEERLSWFDDECSDPKLSSYNMGFGYDIRPKDYWDKDIHLKNINNRHEYTFKKMISDLNYVNEFDLLFVLKDVNNIFYEESLRLVNYWNKGYDYILEYSKNVNENNFKDIDSIMDDIKKYTEDAHRKTT